jgi:hypothetical protein
MDIARGEARYGPQSGSHRKFGSRRKSGSRRNLSAPPSGEVFLARLEVPCFALLEADDATCKVLGSYGDEDAIERRFGGDQSAASRTYGGVTIRYDYPSGAMAFVKSERRVHVTSEGLVRGDATDPRARQEYFEGGLQMLAGTPSTSIK